MRLLTSGGSCTSGGRLALGGPDGGLGTCLQVYMPVDNGALPGRLPDANRSRKSAHCSQYCICMNVGSSRAELESASWAGIGMGYV